MKKSLIILFVILSFHAIAEEGNEQEQRKYTFKYKSVNEVYKKLILKDFNFQSRIDTTEFDFGIIAKSDSPDSLIDFYNYFFPSLYNGVYEAHFNNIPFVISPDIIWLLICQGFARHLQYNPEIRKNVISNDEIILSISNNIPINELEEKSDQLFTLLAANTDSILDDNVKDIFLNDFSISKQTQSIVFLESKQDYFEYLGWSAYGLSIPVFIPEIKLTGTVEDWELILSKVKQLEQYDLKWWTVRLEIILKEIIQISKGYKNPFFWKKMINDPKRITLDYFLHPFTRRTILKNDYYDGWLLDFYPYNKYGNRIKGRKILSIDNLPIEILKLNIIYNYQNQNGVIKEMPLELWNGLIGFKHNEKDNLIEPEIGWMLKEEHLGNPGFKLRLEEHEKVAKGIEIHQFDTSIDIIVSSIPEEIFSIEEIIELRVGFTDRIIIPDKLAKVNIGKLDLYGEIEDEEIERIRNLFSNTKLYINGELIE